MTVQSVIKSNEDWVEYLEGVCRSFGFSTRPCPIIYTLEGRYIGDGQEFMQHVKDSYAKPEMKARKALVETRAQANLKEIEELMRKRREGLNLGEIIAIH